MEQALATYTENYTELKTEILPFTVRIVKNETDLMKAVSIRQSAYGRHLPEFAKDLDKPEHEDYYPDTVVLIDGSPLGTIRIQTNFTQKLELENSVELPAWLSTCKLAEASRLGIVSSPNGSLIKDALVKAYYLHCLKNDIEWMVITARKPLHRMYEKLKFSDVFSEAVPIKHVANIPHKIMCFELSSAYETWSGCNHPQTGFFGFTNHPDICID
jgi:hypothetical protein